MFHNFQIAIKVKQSSVMVIQTFVIQTSFSPIFCCCRKVA
ncbi:CLUMA_CG003083, isoform A [Clunio marinus]|uniref:CLUMA_CG003083, isoform A n=1 Tax=Clunio marinus TaxID=568069 RepID=A0A1J1HPK7_9DIPT|nr:CLUMA_CG003083, isoform A [Clunio marinus]